jgi:hypothetical protein
VYGGPWGRRICQAATSAKAAPGGWEGARPVVRRAEREPIWGESAPTSGATIYCAQAPCISHMTSLRPVMWPYLGANFSEPWLGEVRRIALLRGRVNKGIKEGQDSISWPSPLLASLLVARPSLAFLLSAPKQVVGGPAHRVRHPAYRLRGPAHRVRHPACRARDRAQRPR